MQYYSTSDQSKQQPPSSDNDDSHSETNSKDKGQNLSKKKLEYL